MNSILQTEVTVKNLGDGNWKWHVQVEYHDVADTWQIAEDGTESSYLTAREAAADSLYSIEKEILAEQREHE